MIRSEERYNDFLEVLKEIKGYGLRVFVCNDPDFVYGYIVTVKDNVLYIQLDYFYGYKFSLEYIPSKYNGNGCSCNDEPITKISKAILDQLELDGMAFARKLGVKLYKNSDEFFKKLWDKKDLKEI